MACRRWCGDHVRYQLRTAYRALARYRAGGWEALRDRAPIGHDAFDRDAAVGVVRDDELEEAAAGGGVFSRVQLADHDPGVVVDGDVRVLPSDPTIAVDAVLVDALADLPEPGQLLGIEVHERADGGVLVPVGRRPRLPLAPILGVPAQHAIDGRVRPAERRGQAARPPAGTSAQLQDLPLGRGVEAVRRGPGDRWPVTQPGPTRLIEATLQRGTQSRDWHRTAPPRSDADAPSRINRTIRHRASNECRNRRGSVQSIIRVSEVLWTVSNPKPPRRPGHQSTVSKARRLYT